MAKPVKQIFRENAPARVVSIAQKIRSKTIEKIRSKTIENRVYHEDKARFSRHRYRDLSQANRTQLEAKLTFHAHAVEKGLSHTNLRLQFGRPALTQLALTMKEFRHKRYPTESLAYQNSLSVLYAYSRAHEELGASPNLLPELFGDLLDEFPCLTDDVGGVEPVLEVNKQDNKDKNFDSLFRGRFSVREFAPTPVDLKRVSRSVALSTKAPSVCNRQPARVTIIDRPEVVEGLLRVQGGMTGYANPPVLLLVTVKQSAFLHPTERNQGFIDGGSFSMALLLALEYEGLAACPLNTMFEVKREREVRELIDVPEDESLIMFVAVGNFPSEVKVPRSFRYPGENITRYLQR